MIDLNEARERLLEQHRERKTPARPKGTKVQSGRGGVTVIEALKEVLWELPQEFDSLAARDAVVRRHPQLKQKAKNGMHVTLARAQELGWIKATGRHQRRCVVWRRDAAPKAQEPAKASKVFVPGLDEPELSLEERLEQALKERDKAIAAGQDTLARILQAKVQKLDAAIAERDGARRP